MKKELTWKDIKPQQGKQELAFKMKVDLMIYGGSRGSAKSYLLNMKPLEHIHDSKFRAIFFRREYSELTGDGGLWQTAMGMYKLFDGQPRKSDLRFTFPPGSTVKFSHMYEEGDKESHRGLQYSFIGFDEINQFSKDQVTFLLTCLRSEANMDSYCIGTCNPDPDSWVLELVEWYLDERGFPNPDKCGVIRYFIVKDGDFVFGDSEEYFKENHPESVYIDNPNTGETIYVPPKTFCFISGTIFDNPALIRDNPRYLSELQNLPDHERDRQLWGNWYARPVGSNYFQREWLVPVDKLPLDVTKHCRAWDKASTEPSEVNRYPDYTAASPKIYKDSEGFFYLVGDYHPDIKDDDAEIVCRFRKRAGERDRLMLRQARVDGADCKIVIAVDPGSNGKDAFQSTAKYFLKEGFSVVSDPMPSNKSKLVRFEPFATAAQNGLVRVVRSSFPNEETYNAIMKELETFSGERSTSVRKDDIADAVASAFNYINKTKVVNLVRRSQKPSQTLSSDVLTGSNVSVSDLKELYQEN